MTPGPRRQSTGRRWLDRSSSATDCATRTRKSRAALPPVRRRIVWRDRVQVAVVDVQSQHLAEQRAQVLGVAERVVGRALVACPELEEAVWTEREHAAVVVRRTIRLLDQDRGAARVGAIRIGRDVVARERIGVAVAARRVGHEKDAVRLELRMKRQSEQTLCSVPLEFTSDVMSRKVGNWPSTWSLIRPARSTTNSRPDPSPGIGHEDRLAQVAEDFLEPDGGLRRRARRQRQGDDDGERRYALVE
jgi:hypothetical protein